MSKKDKKKGKKSTATSRGPQRQRAAKGGLDLRKAELPAHPAP